ncbi:histidine kinase [Paenibacillus oryzae]|jgi:NarL family two-component system sensor histidine kinase LiaS|uniref:Oxygen sensor histidine kinase NreB n=1 Tax=Paenibacillus oryzae TaxID=1844972 RepID=A0A1A5YGC1_9BACL|nr:sensor histidine kinase [Paenibacillus oryzae]OBR64450.1 histidine kinase [Paenibacillus oryzae]
MMVRFFRSGKWELVGMFALASAVSLSLLYMIWNTLDSNLSQMERNLSALAIVVLISAAFGYWAAQRYGRRLDTLYLALKQGINGNYQVRITDSGHHSFVQVYREFNELAQSMEEKMKLLQKMGEERVLAESASNEAAVLEERKRLARDLHDTVSQQLFAIHMCASSLPKLQEVDASRAASVLEQLIGMSNLAQKQMRNFIAQLRPMELEGRSLQEALDKWFPDYCRQNGLQGVLEWRLSEKLSEAKEHQLFLIVQEAMANVVKHAKAQGCTLTLADTERQVVMMLSDDGAGFKTDTVKRGSYGLSTMKERAEKLGGTTDIISKVGSGTRIKVTIPKIYRGEQNQ